MFLGPRRAMESIEELSQPLLPPVHVEPITGIPITSCSGIPFHFTGTPSFSTSPIFGTSPDNPFEHPQGTEVVFLNLTENTAFGKIQCRRGGVARMRIEHGVIKMVCKSQLQIMCIRVFVLRTPLAAELEKDDNGKMELPVLMGNVEVHDDSGFWQQFFSVDLDSIYDGPKRPAYKLAKRDVHILNQFQLSVEVQYIGGAGFQEFTSIPFQIKTKEKKANSAHKRARQDDDSTDTEEHDDGLLSHPDIKKETIKCQNLHVIDHLEAQRATIDHVTFKIMESDDNADIAYRFKLKDDPHMDYDEGDIVGFFKDEDGGTVIDLLDSKNASEAFLAGVISRSAYIEVKQSLGKEISDIVCVIGVVKVKCIGSVRTGERIYSAFDANMPGTAIAEGHLPPGAVLNNRGTLLGMALEEKCPKNSGEVSLVKSFVCIVLGIADKKITMEIENMYDRVEMLLNERLKKERKRARRVLCASISVLLFLLFGLSVLAFELFYPGSALRELICKEGSMKGHTSTFKFTAMDTIRTYRVNGIEFSSWKALQDKLKPDIDGLPPLNTTMFNITKVHYYLNLDRCSYGHIKLSSALHIDPRKEVGGPLVYAVDGKCSRVYYYSDVYYKKGCIGGWCPYKSVPMFPRDFRCHPESEFN